MASVDGRPTLTEFLLARIAEDEEAARASQRCTICDADHDGAWYSHNELSARLDGAESDVLHIRRHRPTRVLAECEAKRRIVELAIYWDEDPNDYGQMREALQLLAMPYADHPDYDEAWRP